MLKNLTGALEQMGYLPTDEDFEDYRNRILEDMHETPVEAS